MRWLVLAREGGLLAGPISEQDGAVTTPDPDPAVDPAVDPAGPAAPVPPTAGAAVHGEAAPRTPAVKVDAIAAAAVELARAAAIEVGGTDVGAHLGVSADGERVVTHAFEATLAGYRGWYWGVTVARASRAKVPTVDEVVLLPGPDALRPPPWVPWSERLRAGDLGAGDLLPAEADDPRLVPAYVASRDVTATGLAPADDPLRPTDADPAGLRQVADDLGLGRARVLSRDGRLDAAERWYLGEGGPDTPMARQAPGPCGTCGFLVPVAGSLRAAFGVCANEYSSADGRVVSVEFGCGAHSEAVLDLVSRAAPTGQVYDSAELIVEPR